MFCVGAAATVTVFSVKTLSDTCCLSPDFEALEEAVAVLGLIGLLADDGPKPPGVVDHRAKPVVCTG